MASVMRTIEVAPTFTVHVSPSASSTASAHNAMRLTKCQETGGAFGSMLPVSIGVRQ